MLQVAAVPLRGMISSDQYFRVSMRVVPVDIPESQQARHSPKLATLVLSVALLQSGFPFGAFAHRS